MAVDAGLCFVLRDSGQRHQTLQVIETLQALRDRAPDRVESAFASLAAGVEESMDALEAGQLELLGERMDRAHRVLSDLGLSTEELETAVSSLRADGALGAKLTGAGCGGFALGLFRGEPKNTRASDILLTPEALSLMIR
jgi:mevalonate kinase